MDVLVATPELAGPGGVQSYVLTIVPQLERLGHDVTLSCDVDGAMGTLARERGLRVVCGEHLLPARVDAVYSQTTPVALRMAERYPDAVRILAVHSADLDVHLPVALDGVASAAVVMNDAVDRRVRAMANPLPTVRLRQPIDYARHTVVAAPRPQPVEVLALGNYLAGGARAELIAVCADLGLRWEQVGGPGTPAADPVPAIIRADVVIGQGRSILDAMSSGRPAWVYGPSGGDGWVTEDSYARLEADGFRGFATGAAPDAEAFRRGMASYDPAMGAAARTLIVTHHSPYDHAVALAELLQDAPVQRPPDAPLRELARLVRTAYEHQARLSTVRRDLDALVTAHRAELDAERAGRAAEREAELDALREQIDAELARRAAELDAVRAELDAVRAELDATSAQLGVERERHVAELDAERARLASLAGSLRWRAANAALRPLDRLRRR